VSAVITLVIWDNLFPDRRDAYVLGHLPIPRATLVGGRLLAVLALMLVIAVAAAVPSSLIYGPSAGAFHPGGVVRSVIAHFVATMGASTFAFVVLLTVQGVLLNTLPARWVGRLMLLLQFVFIVAALESLLFMADMSSSLRKIAAADMWIESGWTRWAPPVWFLGLYETIAGSPRPVGPLALRAVMVATALLISAFGLYALTYQRLMRRAVESSDLQRGGGTGLGRALTALIARVFAPAPLAEAVLRFTLRALAQSRTHRLLLTIFLGVGTTLAGAVILARLDDVGFNPIGAPVPYLGFGLVMLFFTISGLRTLFMLPSELPANWIFRLSDAEDPRLHMQGARAALFGAGVLPVIILLAPAHLFLWGPPRTLAHSLVLFAAGALLCELALIGSRKVPFTCTYSPPIGRGRVLWPIGLIVFVKLCYTVAEIEAAALRHPSSFPILPAVLLAVAMGIGHLRELWLTGWPLVFVDEEEDAPIIIKLSGSTQ
jgi:hypothetical protein